MDLHLESDRVQQRINDQKGWTEQYILRFSKGMLSGFPIFRKCQFLFPMENKKPLQLTNSRNWFIKLFWPFPISLYESRTKPRPGNVATSPTVPGRRIGRMNGTDRAFPGHFAKKSLNFTEINPQSTTSHIESSIIPLKLFQNQPAVQAGLKSGLLSTWNGPLWAEFSPKPFSHFSYNFLFT